MINKEQISFDQFLVLEKQLSIKIGKVTDAELVPKSYGLKLIVDFGNGDMRTVFTNLGKTHTPLDFVGGFFPFVINLAPTEIKGVKSEAMIIVGESLDGKVEIANYTIGSKLI